MNKILLGVMVISIFLLGAGCTEPRKLSQQEIDKNIELCNKWGGQVVYDSNGNYADCAMNGRLGDN